jgi:hypothetical protein
MNVYFYKLTRDAGAAPCVADGLLSLAICKPMIRVSAREGDLVFGFAADSMGRDNALVYIAKITDAASDGAYYKDQQFATRADCIYKRHGTFFKRRRDALFHNRPGDLRHDLGGPPVYSRARVLLSTDFRYLGAQGTAKYKARYRLLARAVETLKQGHRVNHGEALFEQLLALKDAVWQTQRRRKVGHPIHSPDPSVSHRGGACARLAGRVDKRSHRGRPRSSSCA